MQADLHNLEYSYMSYQGQKNKTLNPPQSPYLLKYCRGD